jgi:hypothetical protein
MNWGTIVRHTATAIGVSFVAMVIIYLTIRIVVLAL